MGKYELGRVKEILEMEGIDQTGEVRECFKLMEIEEYLPIKFSLCLYMDYTFSTYNGLTDRVDVMEAANKYGCFDSNREIKVWIRDEYTLIYTGTDGKAEEGYWLFTE